MPTTRWRSTSGTVLPSGSGFGISSKSGTAAGVVMTRGQTSPSIGFRSDTHRSVLGWRPKFDDLSVIVGHALAWERKLLASA